ncbi:hypothetical protein ACJX0J_017382, partial [Zea mays]
MIAQFWFFPTEFARFENIMCVIFGVFIYVIFSTWASACFAGSSSMEVVDTCGVWWGAVVGMNREVGGQHYHALHLWQGAQKNLLWLNWKNLLDALVYKCLTVTC